MISACLEEGTLQAYLDGELAGAAATAAASHLANCARCVAVADAAASDDALLASALAPALDANVPSAHLRARLERAICELETSTATAATTTPAREARTSLWFTRLASLFSFNPAHTAAFASLVVVAAFAFVYFGHVQPGTTNTTQALPPETIAANPTANDTAENVPLTSDVAALGRTTPKVNDGNTIMRNDRPVRSVAASYRPSANSRRTTEQTAAVVPGTTAASANATLLPGEQSYLTAIASLTSALKPSEQRALPPTLRAEYERNVAVVDQAIAATRAAAQRNPQDEDAQDFLRAAYQNKVELLHTVADQAQLATLRR